MLTRLQFKNWRTLQDVTIDNLTPITVFIGANSSGKTNIIDALYFIQQATDRDLAEALNARGWVDDIITQRVKGKESHFEVGFTYRSPVSNADLTYTLKFDDKSKSGAPFDYAERLVDEQGQVWLSTQNEQYRVKAADGSEQQGQLTFGELGLSALGRVSDYPAIQQTYQFITRRWQLLQEGFAPSVSVLASRPYIKYGTAAAQGMFSNAENMVALLELIERTDAQRPYEQKLYPKLVEDFRALMGQVEDVKLDADDFELKLALKEFGGTAPSVSFGTARLLAMLTTYYSLELTLPTMPGLVVIEEPDIALNPLLLSRFVGLLQNYVGNEHPRQFIITTHNPRLLDYFQPEEVRIVERDPETGNTRINTLPDDLKDMWLPRHSLGEAWLSRVIGGIPEE